MKRSFFFLLVMLLGLTLVIFTSCGEEPDLPDEPTACVHEYGAWHEPTATCTESGQKGYYECVKCHGTFDADHVEITDLSATATGHNAPPADCTTASVCATCGTTVAAPLGHDFGSADLASMDAEGNVSVTCRRDPAHVDTVCVLDLPSVENVRDVGGFSTVDGGVVKQGLVIRSARLDSVTAADRDYLLNVLGIKTELDLRRVPLRFALRHPRE